MIIAFTSDNIMHISIIECAVTLYVLTKWECGQ